MRGTGQPLCSLRRELPPALHLLLSSAVAFATAQLSAQGSVRAHALSTLRSGFLGGSDSIRSGGPTRSSADFSVPRPRTHDDRAGRVFPDHLITRPALAAGDPHVPGLFSHHQVY